MTLRFSLVSISLVLASACADVSRFLEPMKFPLTASKSLSSFKSSALINSFSKKTTVDSHLIVSSEINLDRMLIEKRLGESLSHRYQASGDVAAFLTRQWNDVMVSPNFILKIQDCLPDELTSSTFVRFGIWDQGELVGHFAEPIKLAHYLNVFFSNTPISRGSRLSPSMFSERPVDVLKKYAGTVPCKSSLTGYQLGASLKANSPLKWNQLSKVTLVRKGKIVDVFASGNGIYVTMKGMSLEDGVEGGMVKVRNLSSEKEFQAKVLNENSVKVHL